MMATQNKDFSGKVCAVSGSGNVAQYTVEKVNQLGGKVISLSDSNGTIIDESGIDASKLDFIMELKNVKRGRIKEYADKYNVKFFENQAVWDVIREQNLKIDVAFPSATQNEIDGRNAEALVKNGCFCVSEGANMPSTPEAIRIYQEYNYSTAPAKPQTQAE
jgi:glutamate dehydrogenase (NADP+)